jgi:hypothetical protein
MQLIVVLGVLVAVNFGIVYVGSESLKDEEPAAQGVVEVETVPDCEPGTDCAKAKEEKPAVNQ